MLAAVIVIVILTVAVYLHNRTRQDALPSDQPTNLPKETPKQPVSAQPPPDSLENQPDKFADEYPPEAPVESTSVVSAPEILDSELKKVSGEIERSELLSDSDNDSFRTGDSDPSLSKKTTEQPGTAPEESPEESSGEIEGSLSGDSDNDSFQTGDSDSEENESEQPVTDSGSVDSEDDSEGPGDNNNTVEDETHDDADSDSVGNEQQPSSSKGKIKISLKTPEEFENIKSSVYDVVVDIDKMEIIKQSGGAKRPWDFIGGNYSLPTSLSLFDEFIEILPRRDEIDQARKSLDFQKVHDILIEQIEKAENKDIRIDARSARRVTPSVTKANEIKEDIQNIQNAFGKGVDPSKMKKINSNLDQVRDNLLWSEPIRASRRIDEFNTNHLPAKGISKILLKGQHRIVMVRYSFTDTTAKKVPAAEKAASQDVLKIRNDLKRVAKTLKSDKLVETQLDLRKILNSIDLLVDCDTREELLREHLKLLELFKIHLSDIPRGKIEIAGGDGNTSCKNTKTNKNVRELQETFEEIKKWHRDEYFFAHKYNELPSEVKDELVSLQDLRLIKKWQGILTVGTKVSTSEEQQQQQEDDFENDKMRLIEVRDKVTLGYFKRDTEALNKIVGAEKLLEDYIKENPDEASKFESKTSLECEGLGYKNVFLRACGDQAKVRLIAVMDAIKWKLEKLNKTEQVKKLDVLDYRYSKEYVESLLESLSDINKQQEAPKADEVDEAAKAPKVDEANKRGILQIVRAFGVSAIEQGVEMTQNALKKRKIQNLLDTTEKKLRQSCGARNNITLYIISEKGGEDENGMIVDLREIVNRLNKEIPCQGGGGPDSDLFRIKGGTPYVDFKLSPRNIVTLEHLGYYNVIKIMRWKYYAKSKSGVEFKVYVDFLLTTIVCIFLQAFRQDKLVIGSLIDQIVSMAAYWKYKDPNVVLLPFYVPFL